MSGPFGSSQWMYKSGGYEIANSVRFDDATSAHMTMTPGAAGNRRLWTWSAWVKQSTPANGTNQIGLFGSNTNNNDTVNIQIDGTAGHFHFEDYTGSYNALQVTEAKLLDYSAWYHLMVVLDTAQSTASNRVKMYINGVLAVTKTGGSHAYPDENAQLKIANNAQHQIGITNGAYHFDGYMADINFVDGAALTPASFGETGDYGEWKPIDTSDLTFGDEGFHLDFKLPTANATNLGKDTSGNSNNFALANIAATDQMIDSPTNNFCTLNFLDSVQGTTEGNLKTKANSDWKNSRGTMFVSSGKWYWETVKTSTTSVYTQNGAATSEPSLTEDYGDAQDGLFVYSAHNGSKVGQGSAPASYGNSYATGDIIGVALDMDNGTIKFYKNNTIQNSGTAAFTNLSGDVAPWMSGYNNTMNANFGQDSSFAGAKTAQGNADGKGQGDFFYTPPSGYLALCTKNLAEPAVVPSENFNTVLYAGDDSDDRDIQVGFRPGWSWFKARNATTNHTVWDIMRGGTKYLIPNLTNAEATDTDGVDTGKTAAQIGGGGGFRLLGDAAQTNGDGVNFASWHWHASSGGGVSNSNGSITSSNNVNTDGGFSISTFTGNATSGATVGHGLSKAPELFIVKSRGTGSTDWWTSAPVEIGATHSLRLNNTSAAYDDAVIWNDTAATSTVFSLGNYADINKSGDIFVAYCFHSVDGYSKIDSYIGNGDADGPYVHLGFRPAWIMIKGSSVAENWNIIDATRSPINAGNKERLQANATTTEGATWSCDFLSNGFKIRTTDGEVNTDAATYIFLAFAETPFKYANAR